MTRTLTEIEELFRTVSPGKRVQLTEEEMELWNARCSIKKALNSKLVEKQPSIAEVLTERGSRYGPFRFHADITQSLKKAMYHTSQWGNLRNSQKEALEMIAHKIGRILNGDPNYLDSWVDIVGYTQLVIDELQEKAK